MLDENWTKLTSKDIDMQAFMRKDATLGTAYVFFRFYEPDARQIVFHTITLT